MFDTKIRKRYYYNKTIFLIILNERSFFHQDTFRQNVLLDKLISVILAEYGKWQGFCPLFSESQTLKNMKKGA